MAALLMLLLLLLLLQDFSNTSYAYAMRGKELITTESDRVLPVTQA
jgi:hypothetical protein